VTAAADSGFPPRPARDLALPPGEIHLWVVALDAEPAVVESLARSLAAEELERAHRFRFDRHRRQYMVGRGALRALLGGYLGLSPGEVRFSYGPRGKPFLAASPATAAASSAAEPPSPAAAGGLFFNLSNSHELALVGFLRGAEIGVDVEFLKPMPDLEQIAERFFSASERTAIRQLPEDQKREGFFNCWTRKEAYLKAVGEGLAAPLDSFDVTLIPGEPPRMLTLRGDAARAAGWCFRCFRPAPDYIGALAVEGGAVPVRTFRFSPDSGAPERFPGY
jgi:4'-phosphopantetheinyl transferase